MITLTVNGQAKEAEVAEDTPLLWILRDSLGMTGTRYVKTAMLMPRSSQSRPRNDLRGGFTV